MKSNEITNLKELLLLGIQQDKSEKISYAEKYLKQLQYLRLFKYYFFL
jgi:hypothetical protein